MAKRSEYTIHGPPAPGSSPSQLHKSLTIRRDNKHATPDLRELYRHSADLSVDGISTDIKPILNGVQTTPNLPPTPPAANGEPTAQTTEESVSEDANHRSTLVTPVNQHSPPTPDNTPPRPQRHPLIKPWLGTQASFASTRAESFRTAREELESDGESIAKTSTRQSSRPVIYPAVPHAKHVKTSSHQFRSPLASRENILAAPPDVYQDVEEPIPRKPSGHHLASEAGQPANGVEDENSESEVPLILMEAPTIDEPPNFENPYSQPSRPQAHTVDADSTNVRRGPSLRDRLKAANKASPSASTEKFASIIGWTHAVTPEPVAETSNADPSIAFLHETKRLSGLSTSSTIGALVVESAPMLRKRTTLRKVRKNDALRSASSPLPASNRTSNSISDSPHRLIHKRSHSLSSNMVVPKPEVIKVAVIPERSSSLQSSANSSKRHSMSNSSARTHSKKPSDGLPPSSWQRKRTLSESERGREKQQTLTVPVRSSSLSAPTSRSTSRANSITSENLRVRRQEAETDLRKTLDKMESERLLSSLRGSQFETSPVETPSKPARINMPKAMGPNDGVRQKSLTPGSSEWAALRPPSVLETPFSQPSYQSASPELNEATAVNIFPHNNHSLQLIEPNMTQESRAVREVRKRDYKKDEIASPLRNPRKPPEPPQFHVIPPSPSGELIRQSESGQPGSRFGSARRRPSQRRSESFVKSLTRGLSLKNPKTRKGEQENDGRLHPMWKPRAFWEDQETEPQSTGAERGLSLSGPINNSLGLPQERTVITGPISLIRRLSERKKQRNVLLKHSNASLERIRATRHLYRVPTSITGVNWFLNIKNWQDRMLYARQKKEDERRERRRNILRNSIGANVISQGDSRFPASNSSLTRI